VAPGNIELFHRGVEVEVPTASVSTSRDGKLVHFEEFGDRHRALEAAGAGQRSGRSG
jgi:ketosteroid isomerase-like protein